MDSMPADAAIENKAPATETPAVEAPAAEKKVRAPRAPRKPGVKKAALPKKITMVNIPVPDMAKAVAFYRDVLGLPMTYESPEFSTFKAGITIGLKQFGASCSSMKTDASACSSTAQAPATFQAKCTGIGFEVKNIEETHQSLLASGVTIMKAPELACATSGTKRMVFSDPFGNGLSCYGK